MPCPAARAPGRPRRSRRSTSAVCSADLRHTGYGRTARGLAQAGSGVPRSLGLRRARGRPGRGWPVPDPVRGMALAAAGNPMWCKIRAIGSLPCPPGGGLNRGWEVWSWRSCVGTVLVAAVLPCAFAASSRGMCPHGDVRAAAMTVRAMAAWYAALARPAALPETHLSKGGSRMAGNTSGRSIPSQSQRVCPG